MSKADISINLIMMALITIVSISLLIGVFGTKLPGFGKEIYCNTFFYVGSSSMMPSSIRVEQNYCNKGSVIDVIRLRQYPDYINLFDTGDESVRIKKGVLYIVLSTKSVKDASVSFSVFTVPQTDVRVDVGADGVWDFRIELNKSETAVLNITKSVNNFLKGSSDFKLPIRVESIDNSEVVVHDLYVVYDAFFAVEEIVGSMISCWQIAEQGRGSQDILCYEVVVPKDFKNTAADTKISEADITAFLIKEGLCDALANNDVDNRCGDQDSITWNLLELKDTSNILVEYDADSKKIVVS
ncbi:MAG: hypothetical protein ABIG95_01270 [Candidatus Woesearchaeota archaeon]